jgi:hypothetical protein
MLRRPVCSALRVGVQTLFAWKSEKSTPFAA